MLKKITLIVFLIIFVCTFSFATGVDTYCYDRLSISEQMAYEAILDCVTHLIPSWNTGNFSQDTIQKAYTCLLMDHPEIFWSDGYTYVTSYINNAVSGHKVEFTYTMSRDQIQKTNKEIENSMIEIVKTLPSLEANYETVRAIYDWFVSNCTYDETNLDQSMYSVMINKSGVCASFSKAFEFLMQCIGIPCTVIHGKLSQSSGLLGSTLGHEWNIIQLNGSWYHVDITSALSLSDNQKEIDYSFLCATTEQILKTHSIANPVEIPSCTSEDLNFFNYYNLTLDSYSRNSIKNVFSKALKLSRIPVAKFTSYKVLCDAVEDLITNQGLFEVLKTVTGKDYQSIDYYVDETELTIKIFI